MSAEITPKSAAARLALLPGDSGLVRDYGGGFNKQFRQYVGTGYAIVNVQLSGWYLDFVEQDHHINTIEVRLKDVNYDRRSGVVTWKVEGVYQDRNGDDDYYWRVWWTILAIA